jgi:hypothetical protein
VDDIVVLGRDDNRIFKQFLAHYDAPAYVRRARQVQEAFDQLVSRCRQQREEWLRMVRIRLGTLKALVEDWADLRPWLANEEQVHVLRDLHTALEPRLRLPVGSTTSPRVLRRALRELAESIGHFNRRWRAFLTTVDVAPINELRDGYNRYFVLEKECALRSARLARQGFSRLGRLTVEELNVLLPPLPVPLLKE